MKYHKISSTDAFIVFDLGDVPSVGVTRLARKVLVDGAELLARSTTYAFASFELRMAGASAGINAEGADRDPAVASFVGEAQGLVASGQWATDPSLGLTEADLAPLRIDDQRPAELWTAGLADRLTAEGAVAAAGAVRDGGLGGATVAFVGSGPVADAARDAATAAGATVVDGDALDAECDVLFVAGKAGTLDHEAAATVQAKVVVPLTPVPVTARAHAVLSQAGVVHVPDFLATAAPLLRGYAADGTDPVERVRGSVAELAGEGVGLWMAAAKRAEEFLLGWQDELPDSRPLA